MGDTNEHEIWGDRATSLTEAMGVMTPPIHASTLYSFGTRKGWQPPTLEGVIAYCERQGLVERYRAFNGKQALKLTGAAVPAAPVRETDPDSEDEEAETAPEPEVEPATLIDCLCARTWPRINYGCPEHGGVRTANATEETLMEKDILTTAQAAALVGMTPGAILQAITRGELKAKRGGRGVPTEIKRADVIAYRDRRKADGDLLPGTPTRRKASAPAPAPAPAQSTAIVPRVIELRGQRAAAPAASRPLEDVIAQASSLDINEVRVLVRWVQRGWISVESAWDKIVELAA